MSSRALRETPLWLLLAGGAAAGFALSTLGISWYRSLGLADPEEDAWTAGVRLISTDRFQYTVNDATRSHVRSSQREVDDAKATGNLADVIRTYTTASVLVGDWAESSQQGVVPLGSVTDGGKPLRAQTFAETRARQREVLRDAGVLDCVDAAQKRLPYPRTWEAGRHAFGKVFTRARVIHDACQPGVSTGDSHLDA